MRIGFCRLVWYDEGDPTIDVIYDGDEGHSAGESRAAVEASYAGFMEEVGGPGECLRPDIPLCFMSNCFDDGGDEGVGFAVLRTDPLSIGPAFRLDERWALFTGVDCVESFERWCRSSFRGLRLTVEEGEDGVPYLVPAHDMCEVPDHLEVYGCRFWPEGVEFG